MAGRLLDRFGRRPVIAVGGLVAIAAILSIFLLPKVGPLFLALRVVQGAGTALVDSGLGTIVADLAPPALRTRVFALYTVWLTLPGGIMPAVGEAIARHAGFFPLFGAAALSLAAALLVFRRLPETMPSVPQDVPATWSLGRAGAPVLVGGVIVGFVFGVSSIFVPVRPLKRRWYSTLDSSPARMSLAKSMSQPKISLASTRMFSAERPASSPASNSDVSCGRACP